MSWITKRSAKKVPQRRLHMNTYEPFFGCLPTSVFVAPFPSNRRFFKEIATYQALICMVMNDTGELMQSATTKTRKWKKGKGLNQNALHTRFCCHRKTNVVKLELNGSPSWLSYLGLLFHHFRSISNFCFRPDDEKGDKWGQETAFIFGQIR